MQDSHDYATPSRSYYDIPEENLDSILKELTASDARQQLHLRGATILTCDPELKDLARGDVVVRGGVIEAVGPDLSDQVLPDAIGVDLGGVVLVPGFVDGHRHTWQSQFRRLLADVDLDDYLPITHGGMALHYRPWDMEIGTYLGLLGALDAGVTTVLDFSHNSRSSAHSDAVFNAYQRAGSRVVHTAAPPNVGEWEEHLPADVIRLRDSATTDLVSVRVGIDIRRILPLDRWMGFARDNGFSITIDAIAGDDSSEEVVRMAESGLLGPDVTLIHCTGLQPRAWTEIATHDVGVTVSTSDQYLGIANGIPPIQEALDIGIDPSLSVDVEISLPSDMFTQMRLILALQRMAATKRRGTHDGPGSHMLSSNRILEFATSQGARDVGLGAKIGRIAPNMSADLVGITAETIGNLPLSNAVGTVVQGSDTRNVEFVLVDGAVRKWKGQLVGVDVGEIREQARASRDYLVGESGWVADELGLKEWRRAEDQQDLTDYLEKTQQPK